MIKLIFALLFIMSANVQADAMDIRVAKASYNAVVKDFKSIKSLSSIKVSMDDKSLTKGKKYEDFSGFCGSALDAVKYANSLLSEKVSTYVTKIECRDSAKKDEKKFELKNKTLILRNQGEWIETRSTHNLSEEIGIFLERITPSVGSK